MRFTAQSGTKAAANLSGLRHPHGYTARYLWLLTFLGPLE
jgi:hypothetical protein